MAKLPNLQQIRDTIRAKMLTDNLVRQSNGDEKPLYNGMAVVPESSLWSLVTWLHEIILPKVEANRGIDSVEYKNYSGVRDAVIWALYISNQYEKLLQKVGRDRQLLGYYIEQNGQLERELQRFTTIESLINTDAMNLYRDSLLKQAIEILNEKKSVNEKTDLCK